MIHIAIGMCDAANQGIKIADSNSTADVEIFSCHIARARAHTHKTTARTKSVNKTLYGMMSTMHLTAHSEQWKQKLT